MFSLQNKTRRPQDAECAVPIDFTLIGGERPVIEEVSYHRRAKDKNLEIIFSLCAMIRFLKEDRK